ncbi:MAG: hypothetical protein F2911_12120 [Actinobacteria bacterium]|nr:hypothetical protein [Actinomycetota bacterium]MSW35939.1 hypothetical protein [Actinomycetota bacterium]
MPGIPEEYRALAARLTAAEGQIFPLVMVDPERYQRAVTLIGLLSQYFTERAASLSELAQARVDAVAMARDLASRQALVTSDLDLDVVADAAMSQRFRSLLVLEVRDQADARLEDARRAGLAWVVMSEPDAASLGMSPHHEWIDVHIATRTELVRTITMDLDTGSPSFSITVSGPDGAQPTVMYPDRQEWLRAAESVRETVEAENG